MTNGKFSARFVIDEHFIQYILNDKESAIKTIKKLSHVHTTSVHHPFTHNIIFDESFKNSIKDKNMRGLVILGIAHPITTPDFLKNEKDFYSKCVRYAISIVDKVPRKIIILTSPEKENNYKNNQHYKDENVKQVIKIVSGDIAIQFIDLVSNI